MLATSEGKLSKVRSLEWDNRACVCVVCASAGYPGNFTKDKEISGLDVAEKSEDIIVFHAATKKSGNKILTNGGRVLGVTGLGVTIKDAINRTYQAVDKIKFAGIHFRKDIGYQALK